MTERIGLEAVFDDSDFVRGIGRYIAAIQEATDLTELAASTISDALNSISSGADLSAISKATQAVGESFDALAVNVEGAVQIASNAIDKLALNTQAASQMASESIDALALNTNAASDMASLAIRGLATDTIDAANDIGGAVQKASAEVEQSFGDIPQAAQATAAKTEQATEQIKIDIADIANVSGNTAKSVATSFGGIQSAISVAQPGIDFFREVTVGAFRQIGAIVTNELQNAMQSLRAFAGELLFTAASQTPLIDTLQSLKEKMAGVTLVSLEPLFNQFDTLVKKAEPAFLSVMQSAETYLGGLASQMFSWGEGAVSEFANGMIAAISAVISALADIANAVAYYLMPHSPPKLLPDIDDWGTETAQIWMDGWGKVDYGVFDQISGTIESLIRSLPLGEDSGMDVISRILGSREGIAAAVNELKTAGAISDETIASIVGSVGAAQSEVSGYIRSLAALTAANEDLQAAQDSLNRVTKEYDDLLKPIDSQLDSIDESQRQLTENNRMSQLALVANDPNATAPEKAQARLEIEKILAERKKRAMLAEKKQAIDNAQVAVDAAKEAQQQAQDAFDQSKAKIDFLTEQNRLLQEQLRLQQELEKPPTSGGAAGGGRPGGIKLPPIGGFGNVFGSLFDPITEGLANLQTAFSNAWESIIQTLQPAIDAFGYVQRGWDNLVSAFAESGPRINQAIGKAVAYVVTVMGINLPTIFKNVGTSLDILAEIWRKHGDSIMAVIGAAWAFIVSTVGASLTAVSGLIAIVLNQIQGGMEFWSLVFQGQWKEAFVSVLLTINESIAIAEETFRTMADSMLALFGTTLDALTLFWSTKWTEMLDFLFVTRNSMVDWITTGLISIRDIIVATILSIQTSWELFWTTALIFLQTTWGAIVAEVSAKINEAKATVETVSAAIQAAWELFWTTALTFLQTTWSSIVTEVTTKINEAKTTLETVSTAIQTAWELFWTTALETLQTTWDSITTEVDTRINEAKTTLDTVGTAIQAAWDLLWNTLFTTMQDKWGEIVGAVSTGVESAKNAISDSIGAFMSVGGGVIDGVKSGVEGAAAGLAQSAANAAYAALEAAKRALGISSPSKIAAALVGKPFVQGIEVGVKDSIPSLERTVKVASNSMLGAGATTITNANNNSRNVTYAPVYNGQMPAPQDDFGRAWALAR